MEMPAPKDFKPSASADEIKSFLSGWYGDMPFMLFAIPSGGGNPASSTFDTVDAATDWTVKQNEAGHSVYFHVNAGNDAGKGRPTKETLTHILAAHVDIDPPENVTPENAGAWRQGVINHLTEHQATTITVSGRGVQGFWRLDQAYDATAENIEYIETINRGLIAFFGGDTAASDATRIMKLSGTVAHMNADKAAAGWQPSRAKVVGGNGLSHSPQTLHNAFAATVAAMPEPSSATVDLADYQGPLAGYPVTSDCADDEKLQKMMVGDLANAMNPTYSPLWRMFTGNGRTANGDKSAEDQSVANALAFVTGCDAPRMERLMRASNMYREKWDKHRTYLHNTIKEAIGNRKETGNYLGGGAAAALDKLIAKALEHPQNINDHVNEAATLGADAQKTFVDRVYKGVPDTTKAELNAMLKAAVVATKTTALTQRNLLPDAKGNPLACAENVSRLLKSDPKWQGLIKLSEFDGFIYVMYPIPDGKPDSDVHPRTITDVDSERIRGVMMTDEFSAIRSEEVTKGVEMTAHYNKFHPVREYLEGIQWDGVPRVGQLFKRYMPCEGSDDYLTQTSIRFAVGAVARIMQPACKLDTMPVLSGSQGYKKSSSLEALCGSEWFGDDMSDMTKKDAKEWLQGVWIGEVAELSSMRGKDIEHVKGFLSTTTDRFRPSYGRYTQVHKRQCVFAGSTNESQYLPDRTGGRRFWPLSVVAVCRVDAIKHDRDQLWAEAVHLYYNKQKWWFDQGEFPELEAAQDAARLISPIEEKVRDYLVKTPDNVRVFAKTIKDLVFADNDRVSSQNISNHMKKCGWQKGGITDGYQWWRRGPDALPHSATAPMMPTPINNVLPFDGGAGQ